MFFVELHSISISYIISMMKKFTVLLLLITSTVAAEPLTCPRSEEISTKLTEKENSWCQSERFNEGANELFELETKAYTKNNLSPLLKDNIHDMKWLIQKSTQDLREHIFCFELICYTLQSTCAENQNYMAEKDQLNWCESRSKEFGKIEQEKTKQVIIENQQRKSRSNLREKMRAIEVRTTHLFLPLLQKFLSEYKWFTEKTPTFVQKPL